MGLLKKKKYFIMILCNLIKLIVENRIFLKSIIIGIIAILIENYIFNQ